MASIIPQFLRSFFITIISPTIVYKTDYWCDMKMTEVTMVWVCDRIIMLLQQLSDYLLSLLPI